MKEHFLILTNLTLHHFRYYMLFCYFCIYVIIIYNYFFRNRVEFFPTRKWKKNSNTRKINYCVLSRCACAKLKIFLSSAKFLKWTPALWDTYKTSLCKKYRKLWTMECVKFAQGWEVVLLIDPNGTHRNVLESTSY